MAAPTSTPMFRYMFLSSRCELEDTLPPGEYEVRRSEDGTMFIKIGDLWFNCTP